jgi:hypothetical protein
MEIFYHKLSHTHSEASGHCAALANQGWAFGSLISSEGLQPQPLEPQSYESSNAPLEIKTQSSAILLAP